MKTLLATALLCLSYISIYAQNDKGKVDDIGRIALAIYVPEITDMPASASSILSSKLNQIATANGMGGSYLNQRFIITANVTVLTKDITPTVPPLQAYTLNVTMYIGDGFDGTKFSSYSVTVKGAGNNETKAYMAAMQNIKTNDPNYQAFVETGKNRIVEYYNTKCDLIIKNAESLASRNLYQEAIFNLTSVPSVCKDCYSKCMDAAAPLFKKQIDLECKEKLNQANNVWAANQSIDGANQAGEILSSINPNAACYSEIPSLTQKIATRVKEVNNREWNFVLKNQLQESERIQATRDIGVAYGKGQTKTVVYNTNGWW